MLNRFRAFDKGSDGYIGADEAAVEVERVFEFMAVDRKAELTEEEFMSFNRGTMSKAYYGPRHGQQQEKKRASFKPIDSDNNGTVSKTKFMSAGKSHYDSSDLDKDGKVSVWEFRSVR